MAVTLNVSNALKHPGQVYPFEAALELEEMEVLSDIVRFEEIHAEGEYFFAEEKLSLKANVDAFVCTRCSKCLEDVRQPIRAKADAVFTRQPDPDDPDLYSFEASTLELTVAVRDALLLDLPIRFLCSEDCKGLCPQCVVNLNNGSCT